MKDIFQLKGGLNDYVHGCVYTWILCTPLVIEVARFTRYISMTISTFHISQEEWKPLIHMYMPDSK